MGILDITNRTEDWQTAQSFAPFFKGDSRGKSARTNLVNQLLEPLEESHSDKSDTVKIELFWYGMRDYLHLPDGEAELDSQRLKQKLVDRYRCLFPNLRDEIYQFNGLTLPKVWNYDVSKGAEEKTLEELEEGLFNNLRNTEIDIVLQTDKYLFIGEAKHESKFGRDGKLVLVHQLIRQYVMATILTDMIAEATGSCPKKIIPFLVGNNLMRFDQVKFMIEQHKRERSPGDWLRKENVLSWACIRQITNPESTHNCSQPVCIKGKGTPTT